MKLKISKSFSKKLNDYIDFIARDKPSAARKFKSDILRKIKDIPQMPYKHRKSIFFDRDDIRDLIFKGYTVIYKISKSESTIEVFGITKYENNPFKA